MYDVYVIYQGCRYRHNPIQLRIRPMLMTCLLIWVTSAGSAASHLRAQYELLPFTPSCPLVATHCTCTAHDILNAHSSQHRCMHPLLTIHTHTRRQWSGTSGGAMFPVNRASEKIFEGTHVMGRSGPSLGRAQIFFPKLGSRSGSSGWPVCWSGEPRGCNQPSG